MQVLLLAHFFLIPGCATVLQISVGVFVVTYYVFTFSCGTKRLYVVAGCAISSVTILQNVYTWSPVILACLYLSFGQADIDCVLSMLLICQCTRLLL